VSALIDALNAGVGAAQSDCSAGPTVERQLLANVGQYHGLATLCDLGASGVSGKLQASDTPAPKPGARPNVDRHLAGIGSSAAPNPIDQIRLYCRRDDYAFLPPGANGGLPCGTVRRSASVDPGAIAAELLGSLSLPSLRLDMNPRLGLVAVPTWFWVEGYGGEVIPLSMSLEVPHEECTLSIDRDARGDVILDGAGEPQITPQCTTTSEAIGVEVRAWPSSYRWDFGDHVGQTVRCPGLGACTDGLGRAYTDPRTPSPIQHAYELSSLGQQGDSDAYGVQLAITFSAEYRFTRNGAVVQDWASLPDRQLSWSTNHRVQEAQAVLTRP
jgi:hypothetical protein